MDILGNIASVLGNLTGWPWTIFQRLKPVFKVLVIALALAAWAPEPLDIIGLAIWGVIAGVFFHGATAAGLVIGFGAVFWFITQLIESVVVLCFGTYLVPGIIGVIAAFFGQDATDALFD